MVKFSDLLVDKSLHILVWRHLVANLIITTSSITYSLVMFTTDGVMLFLQLMDVQNICLYMRFSPNKIYGKFRRSVQDGGIVIDSEVFVHIF